MSQQSYTELKQQREQLEKAMSRVSRKGYAYEVLYTEWRSINDRVLLIEFEEEHMDTKTLTCNQCHKTFTPDQLVLTTDNEETAFCGDGFEFHDFRDASTLGQLVILLLQEQFQEAREIALTVPLDFPDGSPVAKKEGNARQSLSAFHTRRLAV